MGKEHNRTIGAKVPKNGWKHLNLLRTTSNSKSMTSKMLERKILLEINNSYRDRGTVAHFQDVHVSWLKGPHQIPSVSWLCHWFLTLSHLLDCLICTRNATSIVLLLQMMAGWDRLGGGGRWGLIFVWVSVGGQGVGIIWFSFSCAFVFCCLLFSVPLLRWLEDDGCCVYFFVFSLFSLSLVPLTRSY